MRTTFAAIPWMCGTITFLIPVILFAGTGTPGFPAQSVWLSNTSAIAGNTVRIYTTLANPGTHTFAGALVFFVDNERIAEKAFSLEPGMSILESALWKTTEGAHTARAAIENPSGASSDTIAASSAVVAFAAAKPPPSPIAENVAEAANVVSSLVSGTVPYVQSAMQTVHETIEPYREGAVAYLEKARGEQTTRRSSRVDATTPPSPILAASGNASQQTPTGAGAYVATAKNAWDALSQVAVAGALYAVKTPTLFYALLLAILVGTLYALFRWALRRPL